MILRGNYPANVDEKGRLKVPAVFLNALLEYGSTLYVTSLSGKSALIYPMKTWAELENKVAQLSNFHPAKRKFLFQAAYYGQSVELDAQGRILLPQLLRESAKIQGPVDVDVVGSLTYLEIHSHSHLLEKLNSPLSEEDKKISDELLGFNSSDPNRRIEVVEFSPQLLQQLERSPNDIQTLSPDEFERLICDRLHAMGMWVSRVGAINEADGGIDIIAGPKRDFVFPFLIAVQAKHHKNRKTKSGPSPVRQLHAVIQKHAFQAGLLVTNTSFTASALWEASYRPHLVRLRDFQDLKRWIQGNFLDEAEWREIPDFIEYAPGKKLAIPKFASKIRRTK